MWKAKPLADPFADLAARVDREEPAGVVVIGSGYGAGVCAARLAEAGADVVVLERGKEFTRFPETLEEIAGEVQIDGLRLMQTDRLGLYNFYVGSDLDVVVGCGLGGTSLINASVTLKPHAKVFEQVAWPAAIRDEAASGALDTYFARAWNVLRPAQFPSGQPLPSKLGAMQRNGATPCHLTVHHGPEPENSVGVAQPACTHCGDCVTGCNVGAKKTLCLTYLPIAKSYGAKIYTQCDVVRLERAGDLWKVHFQRLESGNEDDGVTHTLLARTVIAGAGVMGTTGILLRSRHTLSFADHLGHRVSGNGDAFAFAYACNERLDTVGTGRVVDRDYPTGATILSHLDRRSDDLARSIVLEEGAFPSGLAGALRKLVAIAATYVGHETDHGFVNWFHDRLSTGRDLLGVDPRDGALNKTMMFLLMGHDGADGKIELDHRGRAVVKWPELPERDVFRLENELATEVTRALGGMFIPNPLNTPLFMNNLVTVHPLGGCAMGDDERAAVDHAGRVRTGDGEVHRGLYVADASVIPTSLGVNPLWTITALAERIAAHAIVDLALAPDLAAVSATGTLKPAVHP